MKMRKLAGILCFVLLLSFFGCEGSSGQEKEELQLSVAQSELVTAYLVESSEKNEICVAYPVISAEGAHKVNSVIYDFICKKTSQLCFNSCNVTDSEEKPTQDLSRYNQYLLTIDCRISYFSNEIISVVFEGLLNHKNAANPMHVFFTLNLDPKSGHMINFADRYCIDPVLYDVFSKYAQQEIIQKAGGSWPEDWGTFSEVICSSDRFLEGMSSSDDFHVFYTAEGVGISYPVPQIDHMEVVLPYSELQSKT